MSEINLLLGPILIGTILSSFFYGIMVLQCYAYHLNYQSDRVAIKLMVAFLLFCDTVGTVFDILMTYNYVVTDFGNFEAIALLNVGAYAFCMVTVVTFSVVQCFYAWRILVITGSRWLCISICATAGISLIGGIGVTIQAAFVKQLALMLSTLRPIVLVWSLAAVVSDSIITISLVWFLHNSRTGFAATDSMLTRLIHVTIQTGLATTTVVVASTVAYLASTSALYYGIALVISKVYGNTLMSTLNMRAAWASGDLTNKQAISSTGLFVNRHNLNTPLETQGRTDTLRMTSFSHSQPGSNASTHRAGGESDIDLDDQVFNVKAGI